MIARVTDARQRARIDAVMKQISPTLTQILSDAATVMIGTWPTPESPISQKGK